MIPKIIHYCWFGNKDIPKEDRDLINGWKKFHPDFKFILWNESNSPIDNIPYLKKASELSNWANMSNYMRLYSLKKYGGIYMDTDFMILKNLTPLLQNECFLGIENEGNPFFVNNAILGAIPNHPFIQELLNKITEEFKGDEKANLSSPHLTTSLLREKGLNKNKTQTINGIKIYSHDHFYPLPYSKRQFASDLKKIVTKKTYAIHLWHESWLSIEDYKLQNIDLKKLNSQLLQKIKYETDKVSNLQFEVKSKNTRVVELENANKTLDKNISLKNKTITNLEKSNSILNNNITTKNVRINELEEANKNLNNNINIKNESLIDIKNDNIILKKKIFDLENSIENIKNTIIVVLEKNNKILTHNIEIKNSRIFELEDAKKHHEKSISEKNKAIDDLHVSNSSLKNSIDIKNSRISELEDANIILNKNLELKDEKILNHLNNNEILTKRIAELEKSNFILNKDSNNKKNEIDELNTLHNKLADKLNVKNQNISNLEKENKVQKENINIKNNKIDELNTLNNKLVDKLNVKSQNISNLKEKLNILNSENKKLSKNIDKIKNSNLFKLISLKITNNLNKF